MSISIYYVLKLLLIVTFIYIFLILSLLYVLFFSKKRELYKQIQPTRYTRRDFTSLIIPLLLSTLIISIRYIYYPGILGFDTVYNYIPYVKRASRSLEDFLYTLIFWRRPLFIIILLIPFKVGLSLELILISLTFIITLLYVISIYYLISQVANKKIALIVSYFATLSYFFIRISWDLLSNFLALVFSIFLLTEYVRLRNKEKRLKYFITYSVCLIFTHPWTSIIFYSIIILSYIMEAIILRDVSFIKKFNLVYLISLFLGSIFILIISFFSYKTNLIAKFKFSASWSLNWYWMFWRELTLTLLLALLGFFYLIFKSKFNPLNLILISWVSILSFLLTLPLAAWKALAYRIIILYPMGILQGIGVYYISILFSQHLKKIFPIKRIPNINTHRIITIFFLALVLVSFLPNTVIHEYVYRPDNDTMIQLRKMADIFGFNNDSNIYLIYDPPARPINPLTSPNIVGWVRTYLGFNYYVGHLLELISGIPGLYGRVYDSSSIKDKVLVFATKLYTFSPLELSLAKEVSDGIYIIQMNKSIISTLQSLVQDNAYNLYNFTISPNSWNIVTRTLKVNLRYIDEKSSRSLRIDILRNSSGWFTIERNFDNLNGTKFQGFILNLLSNATRVSILLEGYYKYGSFTGRRITISPGKIWITLPIKDGDILTKVRIAVHTSEPLTKNYYIIFRYFALFTQHPSYD